MKGTPYFCQLRVLLHLEGTPGPHFTQFSDPWGLIFNDFLSFLDPSCCIFSIDLHLWCSCFCCLFHVFFLPSLLPVFFMFLAFFLSSFLPFFLSSFLPFSLSSFLPFFLSSFLPFFLSSFLPFRSFFLF